MVLLILLSLLLATAQLSFVLADEKPYPDVRNSTAGNWTWKFECCASNRKRFTLEIVAQTLENCSKYSSETSFGTNCKQSNNLNFSLRVGNGSIKWFENNTVCEECNTQSVCHPNVTVNNRSMNLTQGKNEWTSQNHTKVKINFKCTANDNSLNLVLHNTTKSWSVALWDCWKSNSSLVQIFEDQVRDKVKSLLQNDRSAQTGVWIGLERSIFGYNAEWKWISGCNILDSQLNRNVSVKPNSNHHCGMIIVNNTKEINWQDANCHDKLPFICQLWNKTPSNTNVAAENSELFIDIEGDSNSNEECK